jgi:arylsulfatase A-like enzyme
MVLIVTDDQGYGDLGVHGNPVLRTPHLDRLARESVQLTQFHVSPVCAPTRSSLMTGRYSYRTGVVDTYLGRALMHAEEITLAEMLARAGYRTGIFGKWHLGDNYPLRAIDQGFQEALVHRGGGIGQPSDPPGGESYFDPILFHNGKPERRRGYCTDVFTRAAIEFIERNRGRPFFAYLATNAPHAPLEIEDRYVAPYRSLGLDETTAKVYGMVANIDANVGRLLSALERLGLARDTIVVFMTDNGPAGARFNAGMRGRKGSVYEGGIRVPGFVRWPARLEPRKVDRIAAHIDLVPTLLAACGVAPPDGIRLDGRNLLPLLGGDAGADPERTLYFQWHRGDTPELYRSSAARTQRFKLVDGRELYDLGADPGERRDVAAEHPDVVASLRRGYEDWFRDVSATRGYEPPRILVGTPHENPVVLTRQDWRGPRAGWEPGSLGYWELEVARGGSYRVTLSFAPADSARSLHLRLGGEAVRRVESSSASCTIDALTLPPGRARLEAWIEAGGRPAGVTFVAVERLAAASPAGPRR